jgi:O-succinylbenzoic acid--CoA ligase
VNEDALRPSRAAAVAPTDPALFLPERVVLFRDLPALVDARREEVVGRPWIAGVAAPRLETFALLWTALELGVPFVPLHPRLPPFARRELLQTLARTPPPPGTAAVVWTSGTTGAPRGVCLSVANLVAAAEASAANLGWREHDRWLCALPLAHVGGLTIAVRCLLARRAVVALPRFEDSAVLAAIRDPHLAPTLASFVPTMLARLLANDDPRKSPSGDAGGALALLRAILLGGDAAPRPLLEACRARGVAVLPTYGLTEAGGQVATQRPTDPDRGRPEAGAGPPLPGVEVRVEGGRILVRGPTLAHAFLGERPRAPDAWLDTGDLGHLDAAGRLHPMGRARELIITGGENVSPAHVEEALGRCPGVGAALVFGAPDATWGQVVCAALVATREPRPTNDQLHAYVARTLAVHERPRWWVWLDALPTTPSGKLDRDRAAASFREWSQTPGARAPAPASAGRSLDRP